MIDSPLAFPARSRTRKSNAMDGHKAAAVSQGNPATTRLRMLRYGPAMLCLLFIGWEGVSILRHPERGDWATCYLKAARRMVAGDAIHRPGEVFAYSYPPLMAWLVTPLADWSPRQAQRAFYLANALATAAVMWTAWRLVDGPALTKLPPRWQAVFWLTAILAVRFVAAPITHRQFDVMIAAFLLAGLWLVWQRRPVAGGVSLGLATAMKCTPLIFVPYLVWRRQFAAAAIAVVVAASVNLAPDWTFPRRDGGSYLADWDQHFLRHTARQAPGQWFADLRHNQSLGGVVNRGWRMWQAGSTNPAILKPMLSNSDRKAIRLWTAGACLAALAAAWPLVRRGGAGPLAREGDEGRMGPRRDPLDFAFEAATVLCLMLLISPMTSKAHFVVLLLPLLALVRWTVVDGNSRGRWLLAALLATGFCTSRDIVGRSATDLLHMLGAPTVVLILALGGCCHAIIRRQERAQKKSQSIRAEAFFPTVPPQAVTRAA